MRFSIVPKFTADNAWAWVAHAHKPSQELHSLYHNCQLQPLTGLRCEFLFVRFGWDVFTMLQDFLQRRVKRRLKLRSGVEDASGSDGKSYCEG